jgi:hypothetical protein
MAEVVHFAPPPGGRKPCMTAKIYSTTRGTKYLFVILEEGAERPRYALVEEDKVKQKTAELADEAKERGFEFSADDLSKSVCVEVFPYHNDNRPEEWG